MLKLPIDNAFKEPWPIGVLNWPVVRFWRL